MVNMVLPGEPNDLYTFMGPQRQDFRKLSKGVWAVDGMLKRKVDTGELPLGTNVMFKLKAWLVMVIGDQVAMNKLVGSFSMTRRILSDC